MRLPRLRRWSFSFIENNARIGRGIGFVDADLLASAAIAAASGIWTRDKRLRRVATGLELAYRG